MNSYNINTVATQAFSEIPSIESYLCLGRTAHLLGVNFVYHVVVTLVARIRLVVSEPREFQDNLQVVVEFLCSIRELI